MAPDKTHAKLLAPGVLDKWLPSLSPLRRCCCLTWRKSGRCWWKTFALKESGLRFQEWEPREQELMRAAVAREQRSHLLETFFRHLFSQVCR